MASEGTGLGNRAHERHKINEDKFLTLNDETVLVNDISYGGVSLFASKPYSDTATLKGGNGGGELEVRVLDCIEVTVDPVSPDHPYKLRCQFTAPPADDGVEKMVSFVTG